MKRITILGIGAMGERMGERLLGHGYELTIYNRTTSRTDKLVSAGARRCDTPREAAEGAELVIGMLADDRAARQVWFDGEEGALLGLSKGAIALESSTLTPGFVLELAEAVMAVGASFADAPVAGSRPQAEAGQLIYLCGGEESVVDSVRPILSCMGGAIHRVGSVGAGARVKLGVNAYFAVQVVALAEVIGTLVASGLSLDSMATLFGALPITSPALKGVAGAFAAGQFAPLFPISLVAKDLRYAVQEAAVQDIGSGVREATLEAFVRAIELGHGDDNITGVCQGIFG